MQSLFTFTTEPGPCGYLPDRDWSLNYEVVGELTPLEYQDRLKAGWRRFGYSLFRPACPSCRMCLSLRVPVATFCPDRSQRRALAANRAVEVVVGRPEATREKLNLYDRFHEYQRAAKGGPDGGPTSAADYVESFVDHPFPTDEWCYYRDGRLIGVGYVDVLPEAMSAIYFYYDPHVPSPGTLTCRSCRRRRDVPTLSRLFRRGLPVAEYARFRPNEVLAEDGHGSRSATTARVKHALLG